MLNSTHHKFALEKMGESRDILQTEPGQDSVFTIRARRVVATGLIALTIVMGLSSCGSAEHSESSVCETEDPADLNGDCSVDNFERSMANSEDSPLNTVTDETLATVIPDSNSFYDLNLTSSQRDLLITLSEYGYETTYDGSYSFDEDEPTATAIDLSEFFLVTSNVGFSSEELAYFGEELSSLEQPKVQDNFFGRDPDDGGIPINITQTPTDHNGSFDISFDFNAMYADRDDHGAILNLIDLYDSGNFDGSPSQGNVLVHIDATISEGYISNIHWQAAASN